MEFLLFSVDVLTIDLALQLFVSSDYHTALQCVGITDEIGWHFPSKNQLVISVIILILLQSNSPDYLP